MDILDVALVIGTAVKWLVYTALLWIMIKIQKLKYNPAGLFASSLAAVLVNFIPFVGPYLSYVVLVICLWKCTGADIAPDIIFTVGIAGALMFCVNLWLIGMLMGNLRPDLAHDEDADGEVMELVDGEEEEQDDQEPGSEPAAATAPTRPVERSPKLPAAGNPGRVSARTPAPPNVASAAAVVDSGPLSLKGVSFSSTRASVMISDGVQVHTVGRGESFTANLPKGRERLRCEDITKTHVVLKNGGGQTMHLKLP